MYLTSSESSTVGQHCFARVVRLGDTKERRPTEGKDVRRSDLGDLVGDGRDIRRSDLGDIEGSRSTDTWQGIVTVSQFIEFLLGGGGGSSCSS